MALTERESNPTQALQDCDGSAVVLERIDANVSERTDYSRNRPVHYDAVNRSKTKAFLDNPFGSTVVSMLHAEAPQNEGTVPHESDNGNSSTLAVPAIELGSES